MTRILLVADPKDEGGELEHDLRTGGHLVHVATTRSRAVRLPLDAIPNIVMFRAASCSSEVGDSLLLTLRSAGFQTPAVTVRPQDLQGDVRRYHVTIDAGMMSGAELGRVLGVVTESLSEKTRFGIGESEPAAAAHPQPKAAPASPRAAAPGVATAPAGVGEEQPKQGRRRAGARGAATVGIC